MNQTTRQRITGTLVLAVTALVLLPVIFDGEGSYQPNVQPDIPVRPTQPQAAFQNAQRPEILADSDAIRIRPETPATVIITGDDRPDVQAGDSNTTESSAPATSSTSPATTAPVTSASTPADAPAQPTPAPAQPTSAQPTAVQPTQTPAQSAANSAPAQTATLDVRGLPEGWSVRLGSFSSTENASNLVTRLQAAGHRAYTRRVESSQGMLTAVFVGPQVDRAAAQSLMERLRQDFQLNGMVVRYEIEEL
ncbi:MAG: SPOR domain-containing protein [Pseudohongiella sp.]|nr:SPOR domain-containing protein [Pseudohongiella sp.]